MVMECIELNWSCKHRKKVRSSQGATILLNWVKHSFSLWVSLKSLQSTKDSTRAEVSFIIKLQAWGPKHSYKRDSKKRYSKRNIVVFLWILQNFWEHVFTEHLRATPVVLRNIFDFLSKSCSFLCTVLELEQNRLFCIAFLCRGKTIYGWIT